MHFLPKPGFRAIVRTACFVGIVGAFVLAGREIRLFHAGRAIFHVLITVTMFLMLAYGWGRLLGGLWSYCGRISGCQRKPSSSPSVATRRIRTTPFVRATRRAYGHHA